MALRLILVSAVTSLGLDLPSGAEMERWSRSGCAWAASTWEAVAEAWPPAPIPEEAPMGSVACPTAPERADEAADDEAFRAVVDAMASEFVPEAPRPSFPEEEGSRIVLIEESDAPEVVAEDGADDLYPGLAYALNRRAEGLGPMPSPATLDDPATAPGPDARLASAVDLTGRALRAWVSLLQAPTVMLRE